MTYFPFSLLPKYQPGSFSTLPYFVFAVNGGERFTTQLQMRGLRRVFGTVACFGSFGALCVPLIVTRKRSPAHSASHITKQHINAHHEPPCSHILNNTSTCLTTPHDCIYEQLSANIEPYDYTHRLCSLMVCLWISDIGSNVTAGGASPTQAITTPPSRTERPPLYTCYVRSRYRLN
jgi:hypothetical protein